MVRNHGKGREAHTRHPSRGLEPWRSARLLAESGGVRPHLATWRAEHHQRGPTLGDVGLLPARCGRLGLGSLTPQELLLEDTLLLLYGLEALEH